MLVENQLQRADRQNRFLWREFPDLKMHLRSHAPYPSKSRVHNLIVCNFLVVEYCDSKYQNPQTSTWLEDPRACSQESTVSKHCLLGDQNIRDLHQICSQKKVDILRLAFKTIADAFLDLLEAREDTSSLCKIHFRNNVKSKAEGLQLLHDIF